MSGNICRSDAQSGRKQNERGREKRCADCGTPFIGGKYAHFCERCRGIRKRRNENLGAKTCPVCGRMFQPHHTAAKFCGEECRRIAKNSYIKRSEAKNQELRARRGTIIQACFDCPLEDCKYVNASRCPHVRGDFGTGSAEQREIGQMLERIRKAVGAC